MRTMLLVGAAAAALLAGPAAVADGTTDRAVLDLIENPSICGQPNAADDVAGAPVAEMVMVDHYGDRHRVGLIEPGAPVGHMSMIDGKPRSTSCVALDPVDVVVLPKQAFNDILVTLPRLGNKLMLVMLHGLSERLQAAQKQLVYAMPPATSPMPLR